MQVYDYKCQDDFCREKDKWKTDGKLRMKSDEERIIFIFLVEDTTNRSLSSLSFCRLCKET